MAWVAPEGATHMLVRWGGAVESSKFSVDVDLNNQAICGWYAGVDEQTTIELHHRGVILGVSNCNLDRPDVKAAGFHATGMCGFSFPAGSYRLRTGNIYKLVIVSAHQRVEVIRLYGCQTTLLSEFVVHELLPRHEYRYLASPTEKVLTDDCDIIAFKNLMIRLRRGKRGISGRGKFVGMNYPHKVSDFTYFRLFTESMMEFWLSFLDARYLWSLIDTYADYGMVEERLAALAVSNYMYAERFFQTRKCIYDAVEKKEEDKVFKPQLPYWGGMKTNQLAEDDAIDVFFTRNIEVLSCAPVIQSVFYELLRRAALEKDSGLGFNLSNSQYFTEVFDFYKENHFS